jgi:hypothetical protein
MALKGIVPVYSTVKELIEKHGGEIFLALGKGTALEVAKEYGFGSYYKNERSMKSAVMRAFNIVRDEPNKWGISLESVKEVEKSIKDRAPKQTSIIEVEKQDLGTLLTGTRDLAGQLIRRKLDQLDKDPKALQAEKLKDLGWLFGVLFDKGQIMAGKATEHVALMSNIPDHLDPDEALKAIMQMREEMQRKD